jgi:hypothetical protein
MREWSGVGTGFTVVVVGGEVGRDYEDGCAGWWWVLLGDVCPRYTQHAHAHSHATRHQVHCLMSVNLQGSASIDCLISLGEWRYGELVFVVYCLA